MIMLEHNEKIIACERIPTRNSDRDPFSIIMKFFGGWLLRDRFGILNHYLPYRISDQVDEIPKPYQEPITVHEILDELISDVCIKNRRIAIMWSGGVDSTALVCGFMKHIKEEEYSERLVVIGHTSSPEEYPLFYHMMLDKGIEVIISEDPIEALRNVDIDCFTDGNGADQIFGHDMHLLDTSLYTKPLIEGLDKMWRKMYPNSYLSVDTLNVISNIIFDYGTRFGLKVEQFCEFAWLFNFGLKMSYKPHQYPLLVAGSKNEGKGITIYAHEKMQRWAVTNFPNLRKANGYEKPRVYKMPLKHYILDVTNDFAYFKSKGKRNSWYNVDVPRKTVNVLTDNGIKIFSSPYIVVDSFKAQNRLMREVEKTFRK